MILPWKLRTLQDTGVPDPWMGVLRREAVEEMAVKLIGFADKKEKERVK